MRPKITCLLNNHASAVAMYRTVGVLPLLKEFEFKFTSSVDWRDMVDTDILLLQRPHQPKEAEAIRIAKLCSIPIWLDYDDFELEIPKGNPRHEMFNCPTAQRLIRQNLSQADLVTVSTPELKRQFTEYGKNIHVVPNAVNRKWMPFDAPNGQANIVVWRGGTSHDEDLCAYEKEIQELTFEFPETRFVFMGNPYWKVLDGCNQENTVKLSPQDPIQYFQTLKELSPKVVMVPLKESAFNRCKSNIAWIEGTYAGAMTVGPDWEEWQRAGIITYGKNTFKQQVAFAIERDAEAQNAFLELSREWINTFLTTDRVNDIRRELIVKLLVKA